MPSRREWLRITAVAGLGSAFAGPLTLRAIDAAGLRRVRQSRTRMGTVVTLTVIHPDGAHARHLVDEAFAEMERLESILSRYRGDSALGILNSTGRLDDAPPELLDVLSFSRRVHALTDGAFDVTVGPLAEAYALAGSTGTGASEIRNALDRVGMDRLIVDGSTVHFADHGMNVTLDGVAKGYIVDQTRSVLVTGGLDRVLVNAGGDVAAHDAGRSDPWSVGVQDPFDAYEAVDVLRLTNDAAATSALPMQAFVHDRTHPHIIDPRSGLPARRTASVTVLAAGAMIADALSTGLMVLGPDAGLGRADPSLPYEALFVLDDGEHRASVGFRSARG